MDSRAAAPTRRRRRAFGNPQWWVAAALLVAMAALPLAAAAAGENYYLVFGSRVVLMALAAVGLNLVLGFGGMVSLGHALYIGIGSYAVAILGEHGFGSGWLHLGVALTVGAAVAAAVGSVCLRTSGMAFIMITLAFAQMGYYLVVSIKRYGAEEGMQLARRSDFGVLDLGQPGVLYTVCFVCLLAVLLLSWRLVHSRFGIVLRGAKSNPRRMAALGFSVRPYQLAAYVISAEICVVAGVLLCNLNQFASPASMQFLASGELLMMAVLGGMGTLFGPVVGAVTLLVLEEVLSGLRIAGAPRIASFVSLHWMAFVGLFIVLTTLLLRQGLYGSLAGKKHEP